MKRVSRFVFAFSENKHLLQYSSKTTCIQSCIFNTNKHNYIYYDFLIEKGQILKGSDQFQLVDDL